MGQKNEAFSVRIEAENSSRFIRDGITMVVIPPAATYAIRIKNNSYSRADASVSIEDNRIGTWRLEAYDDVLIERDPRSDVLLRIVSGGEIVRVMFKPEKTWLGTTEVEDEKIALRKEDGVTSIVPALARSNVSWNDVTEVTTKLILG